MLATSANERRVDTPSAGEILEETANIVGGLAVMLLPVIPLALPGLVLLLPLVLLALPLVLVGALLAPPYLIFRAVRGRRPSM